MKNRKFNHILPAILIGFLALNMFLPAYSQEKNTGVTNVEVQNLKVREIPDEYSFIGANWYWDHVTNLNIFNNPGHINEFIKSIKFLGVDTVRYPGGLNVWRDYWDVPHADVYKAINVQWWKSGYKLTLPEFLAFCRKAGLKATIQLNTVNYFDKSPKKIIQLQKTKFDETGKPDWNTSEVNWTLVKKAAEYAADEVRWVKNNNYNDVVAFWELGNEEYLRVPKATGYTGKEYAKVVAVFIEELKKVDPDIKIIITNTHVAQDPATTGKPAYYSPQYLYNWNKDLLSSPELLKYKNYIYAVSTHIYPYGQFGSLEDYNTFKKSIYKNNKLDTASTLNSHRKLLDDYGYKNTLIFANEFNATDDKGTQYSNSWLAALGDAKIIMSNAGNPNCYHSDYWSLLHFDYEIKNTGMFSNRGYGLLHYAKDFNPPFIKHPVANVVALLNKNIKGEVLKTSFNGSPSVYALSIQDKNFIKVILLNLENSRMVNLKLTGFRNIKYLSNQSLGIKVPENFTAMDTYDSITNPSTVKQLNELENKIPIISKTGIYEINLPANILSVFTFEKQ